VPVYIGEIAPTALRGTLGAAHQLAIVVGILCTQALGVPLSTPTTWRWLILLNLVPSLVQWFLLPLCAESPRFLLSSERKEEACRALRRLRGGDQAAVGVEFRGMMAARQQMSAETGDGGGLSAVSVWQLLSLRRFRKPLIIAITAQLAQQWSGINGVIQYSTNIFESFLGDQASLVTVVVGLVNLLTTIASMLLLDRAGRRALLLPSQFGMAALSALIVLSSINRVNFLTAAAGKIYLKQIFFNNNLLFVSGCICGSVCNWSWADPVADYARDISYLGNFIGW
jgi:SP family facilitated glucose transporter-like MFS transporter 1